jgi:hypothetical protein
LEYTKQIADDLRRSGVSVRLNNTKTRDPKNNLALAASFL